MKVVKSVFAVMGSFVVCASAAAPVYEAKDADVSSDAVRCRCAGTPVLVGNDAFSRKGFWTLANYDNRLGIEVGGERDGAPRHWNRTAQPSGASARQAMRPPSRTSEANVATGA